MTPRLFLVLLLFALHGPPPAAQDLEALERALAAVEPLQQARLAELQRRQPVPIRPFASDGCSGGLSAGWRMLAEVLPGLRERLGPAPPWEACCVAHDRAYWAGRGEDGYRRRLAADRDLRRCVLETAAREGEDWATRLGIGRGELNRLMRQVAEAMYLAVRLGGGPCTGLPWRWGHGWPECAPGAEPAPGRVTQNREERRET